jgi:hypothetical protein
MMAASRFDERGWAARKRGLAPGCTIRRAGSLAFLVCAWLLAGGGTTAHGQAFSDDPLVAGVTPIRAVHIVELRQAIDQVRAVAGLRASVWTDATLTAGVTSARGVHVVELRVRLDEALTRLGYGTSAYTDAASTPGSVVIRAVHLIELRTRVRAAFAHLASAPLSTGNGSVGSGSGSAGSSGITNGGTNNVLTAGQLLKSLTSADGRFRFLYQSDGNVVLYQGSTPLWASGTHGPGYAAMQADGNFVVYTPTSTPLWNTYTSSHPGSYLVVQNDGNVVIYAPNGAAVWSTGTGGRGGSTTAAAGSFGTTGGGTNNSGTSQMASPNDPMPRGTTLQATGVDTQGNACNYAVKTESLFVLAQGGTASIRITAAEGCSWAANSFDSWMALSHTSGAGTATIQMKIATNDGSAARTGTISFPPLRLLSITQAGRYTDPATDADRDGLPDAWEADLARQMMPTVHYAKDEDCSTPLHPKPVVYRVRPLMFQGFVYYDYIAINYVLLYDADCGRNAFGSHPGDAEPFVVWAYRGADGNYVRRSLVALAHGGTDWAMLSPGVDEIFVSESKHGNYGSVAFCNFSSIDARHCDGGTAIEPNDSNWLWIPAGEPDFPIVHDLGDRYSRYKGNYIWGRNQLLGGGILIGAVIRDGLFLGSYPNPFYVPETTLCIEDGLAYITDTTSGHYAEDLQALSDSCRMIWDRERPFN